MKNDVNKPAVKNEKTDAETIRKIEIESLKMEINTHFLFNTFDVIMWLARLSKQSDIEKLVLSLAKFYKLSLHGGDKIIRVEEEIEMIRHFVEIEKVSYPDKFIIEYNVAEEVKSCMILKLILQPLIENAIKHGIAVSGRAGKIILNVFTKDENIVFEVIDDGVGFDVDVQMQNPKETSRSLKTLTERLWLEYGDKHSFVIDSVIGQGTTITVKIPKKQ